MPDLLKYPQSVWRALLQPWARPFSKADWAGYADATAPAYMVDLPPEQLAALLRALDLEHWDPAYVAVILDADCLALCASSPHNAYAWQVELGLAVEGDRGTPEEYCAGEPAAEQLPAAVPTPNDFWLVQYSTGRWALRHALQPGPQLGAEYASSAHRGNMLDVAGYAGLTVELWPGNPAD